MTTRPDLPDFGIPPVTVDAEPDFTPPTRFEKRPAEQLETGDLLYLDGETWRVKGRSTSKYSPRIRFWVRLEDYLRGYVEELVEYKSWSGS